VKETTTVQGRRITQDDIELVRRLIEADPSQNRSELSRETIDVWNEYREGVKTLQDLAKAKGQDWWNCCYRRLSTKILAVSAGG
jgi:hypothetical protein